MGPMIEDSTATARKQVLGSRLLPVLEELLDHESFIEISIERLVQQAGVSRSGFYLHFSDKVDLLRTLATDVMADLFVTARGWWELPPSATRDDLREALDSIVASYLPHKQLMSAIVEASAYDVEVDTQFRLLMSQASRLVAEHIYRSQEAGSARKDIDVDRVSEWITWMIERGLYQLVATADPGGRDDLMAAATEIIWRTLYESGA